MLQVDLIIVNWHHLLACHDFLRTDSIVPRHGGDHGRQHGLLNVLERASMGFKPLSRSLPRSTIRISGHTKVMEAIGPTDLGHGRRHPVRGSARALGMKVGAKLFDGGAGLSTGDAVVIDADSFLMKGEILDSGIGGVEIRPS